MKLSFFDYWHLIIFSVFLSQIQKIQSASLLDEYNYNDGVEGQNQNGNEEAQQVGIVNEVNGPRPRDTMAQDFLDENENESNGNENAFENEDYRNGAINVRQVLPGAAGENIETTPTTSTSTETTTTTTEIPSTTTSTTTEASTTTIEATTETTTTTEAITTTTEATTTTTEATTETTEPSSTTTESSSSSPTTESPSTTTTTTNSPAETEKTTNGNSNSIIKVPGSVNESSILEVNIKLKKPNEEAVEIVNLVQKDGKLEKAEKTGIPASPASSEADAKNENNMEKAEISVKTEPGEKSGEKESFLDKVSSLFSNAIPLKDYEKVKFEKNDGGTGEPGEKENEVKLEESSIPEGGLFPKHLSTIFTVAKTSIGKSWNKLPYREPYKDTKSGRCEGFVLRVPDKDLDTLTVCLFRSKLLHFGTQLSGENKNFQYENRVLRVHGFVRKYEGSKVIGRIVDKQFYGEIDIYSDKKKRHLIFVVEEIKLLEKITGENSQILSNLLLVLKKKGSEKEKYNAVVTRQISISQFFKGNPDDNSQSFIIFSTAHNAHITSGEVDFSIDKNGRIIFEGVANSVIVDNDGSVHLNNFNGNGGKGDGAGDLEFSFRPNHKTIAKQGSKVITLEENEQRVGVSVISNSLKFSCLIPPRTFEKKRVGGLVCKVCLATDKLFEDIFSRLERAEAAQKKTPGAGGSGPDIESYLKNIVDQVSWNLRSTDWKNKGKTQDIGLDVDPLFYQWNQKDTEWKINSVEDLDKFFQRFSQEEHPSECCLSIGYTMKEFPGYLQSLSYKDKDPVAGGICGLKINGVSHNTILISVNAKSNVTSISDPPTLLSEKKIIYLTLHEVAKAFGAQLDDKGIKNCDQFKDIYNLQRHFVMWPDILRDTTLEEMKFSSCSKKTIAKTLNSCKSSCFYLDNNPYCGNGIIEEGEECDCGSEYNCTRQKCCYSRAGKFPCKSIGPFCDGNGAGEINGWSFWRFFIFQFIFVYAIQQ